MTRLTWDATGERFFETGVDRGVLYPKVGSGLPWNGLISVKESVSGGSPLPYYLDGLKYLNLSSAEEFKATIEALSAPHEFNISDGFREIAPGLSGAHQPRQPFGFTYRTNLGSDDRGTDLGYQIHLVYNAMAAPSSRTNSSLTDTPEPLGLSWTIETVPAPIIGFKPSAHFVVDSTITHPLVLSEIEDNLYGSIELNPSLPSPAELITMFDAMVRGYGHGPYGHGPYGHGP